MVKRTGSSRDRSHSVYRSSSERPASRCGAGRAGFMGRSRRAGTAIVFVLDWFEAGPIKAASQTYMVKVRPRPIGRLAQRPLPGNTIMRLYPIFYRHDGARIAVVEAATHREALEYAVKRGTRLAYA